MSNFFDWLMALIQRLFGNDPPGKVRNLRVWLP